MMSRVPILELANDLRNIYRSNPAQAEALTRQYLEERLKEYSPEERLALLEKLAGSMEGPNPQRGSQHESTEFSKLFSQLLGIHVAKEDLSSTELLVQLTPSLTIIFDTLNQIVGVINATLLGRKTELETIRKLIGATLEEEDRSTSLKNYLDQIKEAFVVAHRAFQQAARTKIGEIMSELNPDRLEEAAKGSGMAHGFKFGPLRKAELFESYKEKYQTCNRWFESGRLIEELLREFEKVCQKIYCERGSQDAKFL